jgi:hypothetical protein
MCGLAVTQLRAGAARLFYGTTIYVLRAADLGRLYGSTNGSCRIGPCSWAWPRAWEDAGAGYGPPTVLVVKTAGHWHTAGKFQ